MNNFSLFIILVKQRSTKSILLARKFRYAAHTVMHNLVPAALHQNTAGVILCITVGVAQRNLRKKHLSATKPCKGEIIFSNSILLLIISPLCGFQYSG